MQDNNNLVSPSGRLLWIDYARFMSLFLVISYHVPVSLPDYPMWSLRLLQLPSFVFISGLLFRFDKYPSFGAYLKHRSRQLLIPYFCFILIFYVLWLGARLLLKTGDPAMPLWQPLAEALMGRPALICSPLWFVACLFALQIIFYILFRWVKQRWVAVIILSALSLSFAWLQHPLKQAPWVLDTALAFLPFYGIAVFFRKEILALMTKPLRYWIALACVAVHIGAMYCIFHAHLNYFTGNLLRIVASLSIIFPYCVLLQLVSSAIGGRRIIDLISSNGVVVLACHLYAISLIIRLAGLTPQGMEGNYLLKYAIAAVVLVLMLVPILLINRYAPFILGKGKFFDKDK